MMGVPFLYQIARAYSAKCGVERDRRTDQIQWAVTAALYVNIGILLWHHR